MLRGYSTKLAADKLKIAPGTVKNHRNSIYVKLDVTSLSELFSLFMQSFSQSVSGERGDPLIKYMARRQRSNN
jgi:hypothetical protein